MVALAGVVTGFEGCVVRAAGGGSVGSGGEVVGTPVISATVSIELCALFCTY